MANETTTPQVDIVPPSVTRNGITKQLSKAVFSPKSETYKGQTFFFPELEEPKVQDLQLADGTHVQAIVNISDFVWFGIDQITGAVDKVSRQVFGAMAIANMKNNDGVLNLEEFLVDAAEFTAARESMTNLRDSLDDLQALQQTYAMDENFGAEETITEEGTGEQKQVKTARAIEIENLMKANNKKITPLRTKIAALEKQYEIVSEKRAATKAANEAKKAALKAGGQVATA